MKSNCCFISNYDDFNFLFKIDILDKLKNIEKQNKCFETTINSKFAGPSLELRGP